MRDFLAHEIGMPEKAFKRIQENRRKENLNNLTTTEIHKAKKFTSAINTLPPPPFPSKSTCISLGSVSARSLLAVRGLNSKPYYETISISRVFSSNRYQSFVFLIIDRAASQEYFVDCYLRISWAVLYSNPIGSRILSRVTLELHTNRYIGAIYSFDKTIHRKTNRFFISGFGFRILTDNEIRKRTKNTHTYVRVDVNTRNALFLECNRESRKKFQILSTNAR